MSHFLYMGGYAAFVWPSYALTMGIVVLNIVWARRSLASASQEARRRLSMKDAPR
jgi:heme exporter protein CcmD